MQPDLSNALLQMSEAPVILGVRAGHKLGQINRLSVIGIDQTVVAYLGSLVNIRHSRCGKFNQGLSKAINMTSHDERLEDGGKILLELDRQTGETGRVAFDRIFEIYVWLVPIRGQFGFAYGLLGVADKAIR